MESESDIVTGEPQYSAKTFVSAFEDSEHGAAAALAAGLAVVLVPDLRALPIEDDLLEAVLEAKKIKAHGALRRQKQYIGKLMRDVDPEPLQSALERLRRK